eukprot:TRINITY_DN12237_c0_g1_i1.p1 TRINITY_DN12237_c0_g1~~TRINITY_DN12237_c0_g1_i1.p1  ORF type:complete len:231 (-),score=14.46 TRINITY_DN12237_c0_g1_i1:31-723(-)
MRSPYSAQIVGRRQAEHFHDFTQYYILVTSSFGGQHTITRRFSEFEALVGQMSAYFPIPTMPPKSFFQKRLSASFQDHRHQRLTEILDTIMLRDPGVTCSALRTFLGLQVQPNVQPARPQRPRETLRSTFSRFQPLRNHYCQGVMATPPAPQVTLQRPSIKMDKPTIMMPAIIEVPSPVGSPNLFPIAGNRPRSFTQNVGSTTLASQPCIVMLPDKVIVNHRGRATSNAV